MVVVLNDQSMQTVRIRFLADLSKDHYLTVSVPSLTLKEESNSSKAESSYESISHEREIFLKAAIQLLDQRENPKLKTSNHRVLTKPHKIKDDENKMFDVIRLGILQKGSNSSSISTLSTHLKWKTKYVELRHGCLTYFSVGNTIKDLASDSSGTARKRSVMLNSVNTTCKVFHGDNGQETVFEVVSNGTRKFWMTTNAEECREWVRAIRLAMIGNSLSSIKPNNIGSGIESDEEASDHSPMDDNLNISVNSIPPSSHWLSIDGAAAPYARQMSQYIELKSLFYSAVFEREYHSVLKQMHEERISITIPVLFVKVSITTFSSFFFKFTY